MSLPTITPERAKALIAKGAILIDIRGADEYARERIAKARNQPVGELGRIESSGAPVIFHCKAGNRTAANVDRLASAANCEAYILEGGIEAWKQAGLPVLTDTKQPIEIMRQVQITSGSLVLAGMLLGAFVSPAFYWLSGFIGAGLVFAGVSGWCGMAKLLAVLPWNRRARAAIPATATR